MAQSISKRLAALEAEVFGKDAPKVGAAARAAERKAKREKSLAEAEKPTKKKSTSKKEK